jgi:hypothetical protein
MNTPVLYRNFFKDLVTNAHTDNDFPVGFKPTDFFYADSTRFIQSTRNEVSYPALVLEVPTYYLPANFAGTYTKSLRGAFSIVSHCKIDDWDEQDIAQSVADIIGEIVLKKMKNYLKPTGGFFNGNIVCEPVMSLLVDNNYGYRFEYYIENLHNTQLSPCP